MAVIPERVNLKSRKSWDKSGNKKPQGGIRSVQRRKEEPKA